MRTLPMVYIRIHPVVAGLVEEGVLEKLGASKNSARELIVYKDPRKLRREKTPLEVGIGPDGRYAKYHIITFDKFGNNLTQDTPGAHRFFPLYLPIYGTENMDTGSFLQRGTPANWQERDISNKLHIVIPSTGRIVDSIFLEYTSRHDERARRLGVDYKLEGLHYSSDWPVRNGMETQIKSFPAPWDEMTEAEANYAISELMRLYEANGEIFRNKVEEFVEDFFITPSDMPARYHRTYPKPAGASRYDIAG